MTLNLFLHRLIFYEGSDSPDTDDGGKEEDEEDEYVPEWQEEYDEDLDDDDDDISYDDESENLGRDCFFFDDEDEPFD